MAHWVGTLEAAWFSRRLESGEAAYLQWQPPQGSRPWIDTDGLLASAGDTRLVSSVRLDSEGSNYRFILHITASQSGGIGGGQQDLSSDWEGNHNVRIEARGETWDLPLAATDDPTEHYIYVIPEDDRDAFDAFITAVGAGNAAHGGTITLWDGRGTDPFAELTAQTLATQGPYYQGDTVTLSLRVGGTATGAISYQWQLLSDSTWSDIAGATGATYDRTETSVVFRSFRCVVTRQGVTVASQELSIAWGTPPTAPSFSSAATNADGTTVTLTFDEALDTGHVPDPGDFDVQVAGAARAVAASGVAVSGRTVVLTLASAVANGETVTVAYTDPGDTTSLQDAAGNAVATFTAQSVTNNVPAPSILPYQIDLTGSGSGTYVEGFGTFGTGTWSNDALPASAWTGDAATTIQLSVRGQGSTPFDAGDIRIDIADTAVGDLIGELESARLKIQSTDGGTVWWEGVLGETDATEPYVWQVADSVARAILQSGATTVRLLFEEPNIRIAGIATYNAGGSAALTVTEPDAVRIAGIATYNAGGAASLTLTVDEVPDVRIAGIATYNAGGSAALTVTEPRPDDTTAPSLESAATNADGTAVTLTFDEALDSTAAPAASAFALTVDGTAASLQSVAISGATVTLNLAASVTIEHGDAVTVAYTAPAQNPLQDAVGNDVASFTAQTVTNSVPRPSTLPWTLDLPHATGSPTAITRTWNASIPSDRTASGLANAALQVTVTYLENFLTVVEIEIGTGTGAGFQAGATGQDLTVELEEARLFLQNADGSVTLWEGILGEVDSSQSEPYDLDATEDETLAIHGQTGALRLLFEEPNIRIAGIASYDAGGAASLTVTEPADVRIAGIASYDAGGAAALTVTEPADVRIAGIATYEAGGAAALTVTEPDAVRIAGIATYNAGGAATLTVDPLGRLFPHEGTLTKSGSWWNEETGTIPAALTSASSGDQALNVRVTGDEGDRSLRIRLSGGTTVAFASAVLDAARLALWDASSADPDEFLIDVRLSGDTSSPYDIPISEARYDAINGAGNTLFYRLHLQPASIRVEGIASYDAGGAAALTVDEVPDVRIAGIPTYEAGGSAALTVVEPAAVRIAGIATYNAGGAAALTVDEVPDVRVAGIATYEAGGAAALTVTEPDAVRIAGIATYNAGGAASLTVTEPADVRIAGIASYDAGGAASLTVTEPADVRIAGIATYEAGGAAALTVTEPDAVRIAGIATYLAGGSATLTIDELVQQIVRIAGIATYNAGGAAALTVTEPQPIDDPEAFVRAHARDLNADAPRLAMEITHPDITDPVRIVADNADHTIEGETYTALAFRGSPPQIREGESPAAEFEIDNVGRELIQWIERTGGGRGASVRVMLVHFDPVADASVIGWELPAVSVGTAQISNETVSFRLVFRSGRSRPGIKWRADPVTSPGLF